MALLKKAEEKKPEVKKVEVPKQTPKQETVSKKFSLVLAKNLTTHLKKGMSLTQEKYNELKSRGVSIDYLLE